MTLDEMTKAFEDRVGSVHLGARTEPYSDAPAPTGEPYHTVALCVPHASRDFAIAALAERLAHYATCRPEHGKIYWHMRPSVDLYECCGGWGGFARLLISDKSPAAALKGSHLSVVDTD